MSKKINHIAKYLHSQQSLTVLRLLALLPDAAEQPSYIAFLAVGSAIGLIILWSRRIEICDYIATNRSPRGSYVGWTSLRFLLMFLFLIMATASSFSLM